MKCPACQYKQRRGREGMNCKFCNYTFVFDPKKDKLSATKKLHDELFGKIVKNASASGSYFFTENQLYSSARQFCKSGFKGTLIAFLILLAVTLLFYYYGFMITLFFGFITMVLFFTLLSRFANRAGISPVKWNTYVTRWLSSGKQLPGLIRSPALINPPQNWAERDIYDYGVSGIILCNRPEIVDWLVLNNFHAQNNKLILTPSGYPNYLVPHVRKLLADSNTLPVWLLHDSGSSKEQMLRDCIFPVSNTVDLGVDASLVSNMNIIRSRFPRITTHNLPVDYIPYQTLSAAMCHCLVSGGILAGVMATSITTSSDTDVSFG
jgi:hypothetical protein